MNKSFSQIKTDVGNLIRDTSTGTATLIGVWINNRYRDIIDRYEWEELYFTKSITASASIQAYPLDEDTGKIIYVLDATDDYYVDEVTEPHFMRDHYDDWDNTGTPGIFYLKNDVVRSQPSAATKPMVVSSEADTTQTILIRGIVSNAEIYESVTLNGTTNVTASNSYSRILAISKSAATLGKVTIYENDGTTILSILPAEQLESRNKSINFHPIPASELIYTVRAKRRVLPLNQTLDYPVIENIADIIEYGAAAEGLRYKRKTAQAREYEFLYEKAIADKIYQRVATPGKVITFEPLSLNRDEGIL